ncbi:LIC11631 family protein [Leptospira ilyithenensis]|uniref:Uncharacterized protein n=1 Tax=Leptospira ilyithenensis TaxID=2484901 RepID=A0A4R9LPY3_9LEPT|nr:hypothetical protein [Leptospira ilyithenensis]TGN08241.1 hypothetical protein EHS11_15085 [Leptospira ilyithenensis]
MSSSDGKISSLEPSVFYPYIHQDFYGMDSLFLSPLQKKEIWDFTSVTQIHTSFLAFLTLRSFLSFEENGIPLTLTGLPRIWKSYLSKTNYLQINSFLITDDFVPSLIGEREEETKKRDLSFGNPWKHSLRWEYSNAGKKVVFFCASGKDKDESTSLSELLSQFLIDSQKTDRLMRAYIRKETSSYLYLQSAEQIHPRVFFRETPNIHSPFLLFIAELTPV